ncbi:MAG: hypothetical protein AAFQ57_10465 [Cyanobacteria bacterium J06626_14]
MAQSRLQRLGTYLRPYRKPTAIGIGALLVVNAISVYIPELIREGIDTLETTFRFADVTRYAVLTIVFASMMWGVNMFRAVAAETEP